MFFASYRARKQAEKQKQEYIAKMYPPLVFPMNRNVTQIQNINYKLPSKISITIFSHDICQR